MRPAETLAVDANVLVSALIGGASRAILFDGGLRLVTTAFTLGEVDAYAGTIARKAGVGAGLVRAALALVPVEVVPREGYEARLGEAGALIGAVDPKDVEVLALALSLDEPAIWTNDRHFRRPTIMARVRVLGTDDLVRSEPRPG